MIDLDRAVAFVHQTGNRLDSLRLRRALGDPVSPADAEAILADEPLVAKGTARLFALRDEAGTWSDACSSLVETTLTALRLIQSYPCTPPTGLRPTDGHT